MPRLTRRAALAAGLAAGAIGANAFAADAAGPAERWGLVELALAGPSGGNPFMDVRLTARFSQGENSVVVPGFYDGDGVYRVRFSPPEAGVWRWETTSNALAMNGREGTVDVAQAGPGNPGPVGVVATYHFAHADGTPFRQIGTTSYGWTHQPEAMRRRTLASLSAAPFNKIRMLVFPNESVAGNDQLLPFERTGPGDADWDSTRFNPAFFQRLDRSVAALMALGIQADVILFHPYDERWNFNAMSAEADERYLRYVVARLSAHRNVWWSLANEYDLVKPKTDADFDRLFQVVQDADPHGRLRSIHNWRTIYDNGKPWVTHASIQNGSAVLDDARAVLYRDVWRKPVIFDEICYEGTIEARWGDLTGPELVRGFWQALIGGTYCGHSEAFQAPGAAFWLGEGGRLKGESPPRLAFLKSIMETGPRPGVEPIDKWWEQHLGGAAGQFYLRYFGEATPEHWALDLPRDELAGGEQFRCDVIDTWNMTVSPVEGIFTMAKKDAYFFHDPDRPTVDLPGRPWMAIRVSRVV